MSAEYDVTVERFLAQCCTATGRPDDQVRASVMLVAYQDWAFETKQPPVPDRTFYRVLRTLAGQWRDGATGHFFSAVKASVSTYRGLQLLSLDR